MNKVSALRGGLATGVVLCLLGLIIYPQSGLALSVKAKNAKPVQVQNNSSASTNTTHKEQSQPTTQSSDDRPAIDTSVAKSPISDTLQNQTGDMNAEGDPAPSLTHYNLPSMPGPGGETLGGAVVTEVATYGTNFMFAHGLDYKESNWGYERRWRSWDAGKTWELIYPTNPTQQTQWSLSVQEEIRIENLEHIWRNYGSEIYFSSDAGSTWTLQKPEYTPNDGKHEINSFVRASNGNLYALDDSVIVWKLNGTQWQRLNQAPCPDGEGYGFLSGMGMVEDPSAPGKLLIMYSTWESATNPYAHVFYKQYDIATNTFNDDPLNSDVAGLGDKMLLHHQCGDIERSGDYVVVVCEPLAAEQGVSEDEYGAVYVKNSQNKWLDYSYTDITGHGEYVLQMIKKIRATSAQDGSVVIQNRSIVSTFDLTNGAIAGFNYDRNGDGRSDLGRGEIGYAGKTLDQMIIADGTNFETPRFAFGYIGEPSYPRVTLTNVEPTYHAGDMIDINVQFDITGHDAQYFNRVLLMQIGNEYYSLPSGGTGVIDLTPTFVAQNSTQELPFFGTSVQLPPGATFDSGICATLYAAAVIPHKSIDQITPEDILGGTGNVATAEFCLQ